MQVCRVFGIRCLWIDSLVIRYPQDGVLFSIIDEATSDCPSLFQKGANGGHENFLGRGVRGTEITSETQAPAGCEFLCYAEVTWLVVL